MEKLFHFSALSLYIPANLRAVESHLYLLE
jgi:hypothetical protein